VPRLLRPKDSSGRITSPTDCNTLPRKRDIAARYGVSLRTVDRWVNEKKIPYIYLDKRTIRFRWADVERAVNRLVVKEVA
jgi:excisionase family DNA binding protein